MLRPRKRTLFLAAALLFLAWWLFLALPGRLFTAPPATVLEDRDGRLLGAYIAADGQWRFPAADTLPARLATCITAFEDRRFYSHVGIDIRAIGRAVGQNWRAGGVVSGGSTISMQVIRLAKGNPPRNLWHKFQEALLAPRLELRYSKAEIINFWASNAPFGGNTVGVEAAAWRYFGRPPDNLSWAEAATLAVLPNAPGLLHPGRSRDALQAKRDRLLQYLFEQGLLDETELQLARDETLPAAPRDLPRLAPHLLQRLRLTHGPGRYRSSLDAHLQAAANEVVARHAGRLAANLVHNAAALIVDVRTGRAVAYVGNVPDLADEYRPNVDIVTAPRSPGSLLKPALYGMALSSGIILPETLLPDVPVTYGDFSPANFSASFSGAVPANRALTQSLNLPFVELLRDYGIPNFHRDLQQQGFRHLYRPADDYGLSLVLGGCEITLEEAVGWFAGTSRRAGNYYADQGRTDPTDYRPPTYLSGRDTLLETAATADPNLAAGLDPGAAWFVLDVLTELERPDEEGNWERFSSAQHPSWKTGTSFGFRDAWAVGTTGRYAVGVWVGNADGEGRPGLIGVRTAAPIFFDLLRQLPERAPAPPEEPWDEWREISVCTQTGRPARRACPAQQRWVPKTGLRTAACSAHEFIYLDPATGLRVSRECAPGQLRQTTLFQLPPLQAFYYRRRHPAYVPAPAWDPACAAGATADRAAMHFINVRTGEVLRPGRELDGSTKAIVFNLAHSRPESTVYWHLDDRIVGTTVSFHSIKLQPPPGDHRLTVVDDSGARISHRFRIE